MGITSKKIRSVGELLLQPLNIPDYQRPYKWQASHVHQLVDDLLHHRSTKRYRLGTVVLHVDESTDAKAGGAIVDGQQRLLTLTLLCSLLDEDAARSYPLLETRFGSSVSIANLRHNAAIADGRLRELSQADRVDLLAFILGKCELICVTLDDLSEAFQFFDSQNARGVELLPHDLLKAFHLREMVHETEAERDACASGWEERIAEPNGANLKFVMSRILFRLRQWSAGRSALHFTRKHVSVFKGVNLHGESYRHTDPMRRLDAIFNEQLSMVADERQADFPYLVDQVMLNGRHFFRYVRHYTDVYLDLFENEKIELSSIMATLNAYEGRGRTGDRYVRELFVCAVLHYHDKFGDKDLEAAARLCFVWSYRLRLLKSRIELATIDNAARDGDGLISVIRRAIHPRDVLAFSVAPVERSELKARKVKKLVDHFEILDCLE